MCHKVAIVAVLASCCLSAVQADTLKLRDGKSITGTFLGGSSRQIEFLPHGGQAQKYPIDQVLSLSFDSASPSPATSTQSSSAQPSALKPGSASRSIASKSSGANVPAVKPAVTLPEGTLIRVRTIDTIDADVSKVGTRFLASIDEPIIVGGSTVIPRGANATLMASRVQQSGRFKGSDLITLRLSYMSVNGKSYPVTTTYQELKSGSEGNQTAAKVLGGAGAGAVVGAVAGGGKGAAIGAAAGAGGGAIIAAAGQQHLKVPPETRLEFRLSVPVKIQ
jgi:hypothetical protein